ncbi:MAG: prenyltransferase [Candidatus Methanomethylophilaceae archaeon]
MTEYVNGNISLLRKINLVFRFSYTLPFFVASLCGVLFALSYGPPAYVAVLIPAIVLVLAVFVNFSNDYFDHGSGADMMRFEVMKEETTDDEMLKKLYWEGNQFDTGMISEAQGKMIMVVLAAMAVIMAVPVVLYGGWEVVLFGTIGLFITYFYTAPPINFGGRGMGELVVGVSFFMMVFCSFYVLTGTYTLEIILFSLMVGMIVGLMRTVDSMSAQEAHIKNHEMSISVYLGIDGTIPVIKVVVIIAYVIAVCMMYFNLLYVLLLLTIPLMAKAWKSMNAKEFRWEFKVIPYFFGLSLFTEILFIVAIGMTALIGGPVVL